MSGLNDRDYPQAITEDIDGLPEEPRTVTYMGREIEIPHPDQGMSEYIEQSTAEGLSEHREVEAQAMYHIWHPSDNECNIRVLPSILEDTPENCQLTTISSIEPSWELSISDVITTDKYKEMEKRVEEQDKTIAEMKSIIENLQDIVYQRKLDKEAENLVL